MSKTTSTGTATTATTASPSPVRLQPKTRRPWTNTNSDEQCLQQVDNPLSRFWYILSLKTGFYAIEANDRRVSLLVAWFMLVTSSLMLYVFGHGVRNGWQDSMGEAAAAALQQAPVPDL
jgi:hypothetical protein